MLIPPTTDENGKALPQIIAAVLEDGGTWESWVEGVDAQAFLYADSRVWIANKWQTQLVSVRYIKKFLELKADLTASPKADTAVLLTSDTTMDKQPDALTILKISHFGIRDKVEQSLMER